MLDVGRKLPEFRIKECAYCGTSFETRWGKTQVCGKLCNRRKWEQNNPGKVCAQRKRSNDWKKRTGYRNSNEARKAWYHKNKEKDGFLKKSNEQGVKRNRAVKEFIAEYKLNFGCTDCGFRGHHAALEFDHVIGDKLINVSHAKSINQAKLEISKCEVVCSNCHRIRTYQRLYPCKDSVFKNKYEPVGEE